MKRPEILSAIREVFEGVMNEKFHNLREKDVLGELGFESIDLLDTSFRLERRFGVIISPSERRELVKVKDLVDLVERKLQ